MATIMIENIEMHQSQRTAVDFLQNVILYVHIIFVNLNLTILNLVTFSLEEEKLFIWNVQTKMTGNDLKKIKPFSSIVT